MAAPSGTSAWLHQPSVRYRLDGDRLLDQAEKQFAAVPGRPTVEAKGELVEVVVQMRVADGALMGAQQPSLEQGDDAVDARQQFGARVRGVREGTRPDGGTGS